MQQEEDYFHQQIGRKFGKKLVKCYIRNIALSGAEAWTFWKVDQKYLVKF
jgi:hypothetical protein